jgi:hypothetical protein
MRMSGMNTHRRTRRKPRAGKVLCLLGFTLTVCVQPGISQTIKDQAESPPTANTQATNDADLAQRVRKLTEAMTRTQAQLEKSQRDLEEMRHELTDLLHQLQPSGAAADTTQPSADQSASTENTSQITALNAAIEDLRERQDVAESQIATHEQAKVESASKYPLRLRGMVLFNAFVNTGGVYPTATPAIAAGGPGSTGATVAQTTLGLDATGPHLFGAQSYGDLDVDFYASTNSNYASWLLRLRTAHALMRWRDTEAWFALDRPLISPLAPSSLTAVAQPPLAWSGNLWTWNPQVGATRKFALSEANELHLETALIDVGDAPYTTTLGNSSSQVLQLPTTAQRSRWPGVETRIALASPDRDNAGNQLGMGAYVAPHSVMGYRYNAWAASADGRLRLPGRLELEASLYRGLALGGLGGGAYKDFAYSEDLITGEYYFRALDGWGGWSQLKEKISDRVELNAAFGTDQIVAHQFRPFATGTGVAQNLVANRTFTGNVIYRPSAYLLFSLEYRHLMSSPAIGAAADSNVIGLAAGYSF